MVKIHQDPTIEQLLCPELVERLRSWLRTQHYEELEMVRMLKRHPEPYMVLILTFLNREATIHSTTADQLRQTRLYLTEILRIHTDLFQHYTLPIPHKPSLKYIWFGMGLIIGIAISLAILTLPSKFRLFE